MLFHYENEMVRVMPCVERSEDSETPAVTTIRLTQALSEYFGIQPQISHAEGERDIYIAYHSAVFSNWEYGDAFGYDMAVLGESWPVWLYGVADDGELVRLCYRLEPHGLQVKQQNLSGEWQETLQDFCLCLQLPDRIAAGSMSLLLRALETDAIAVALEWEHADFVQQQALADIDRTWTFCYVVLSGEQTIFNQLLAPTLSQKRQLWRLFLQDGFQPPEFEWLQDAVSLQKPCDWLDWVLSLCQTLEELGYQTVRAGNRFELLDGTGRRIYYSVDHPRAAERLLMKILFPLNL